METLLQITAPSEEPLEVFDVRENHLRVANGTAEDDYIARLIKVARQRAERVTRRSLMPQTWALVLDRFPCAIRLPRPPILEVVSITYLDEDGVEQTLDSALYKATIPTGPTASYATIRPSYDETWPDTRVEPDAVTVTYRAGYEDASVSPAIANVPEEIVQGMLLTIGELYKLRSESVHAFNQNPALIRARDLWLEYRVY